MLLFWTQASIKKEIVIIKNTKVIYISLNKERYFSIVLRYYDDEYCYEYSNVLYSFHGILGANLSVIFICFLNALSVLNMF